MAQLDWTKEFGDFRIGAATLMATLTGIAGKSVSADTGDVAKFDADALATPLSRLMRGYVRTLYASLGQTHARPRVDRLIKAIDGEAVTVTKATTASMAVATSYRRLRTRYPRSRESEQAQIRKYMNTTRREELAEMTVECAQLMTAIATLNDSNDGAASVFVAALDQVDALLVELVESAIRLQLVNSASGVFTTEGLSLAVSNTERELRG